MKKYLITIFFIVSFALLISSSVFASMALPRYGINEQTRECSEFFMGDECVVCTLPADWQMLEEFQCPQGYREIKKNSVYTPTKTSFCCSVSHSGANGDCEDVVVNNVEQKCAFVEDINQCERLPENWKEAKEVDFWGKVCPSLEYEWLEETLKCGTKILENDQVEDQKNISNKKQESNIIPATGFFTVLAILSIILWFSLHRRRRR